MEGLAVQDVCPDLIWKDNLELHCSSSARDGVLFSKQ